MILNKLLYRISLNKARSWIMVFNCNMNAFSGFTTIINLYNENMSLEMTIKKLGSVYKFRVGRATGNEHIFLFGLNKFSGLLNRPLVQTWKSVPILFVWISEISGLSEPGLTNHHCNSCICNLSKLARYLELHTLNNQYFSWFCTRELLVVICVIRPR